MKRRKGDVLFAIIFGGGFLALGLFCLSWSIPDLWVGMRSYTWPEVDGRVIAIRKVGASPTKLQLNRAPLLYEYGVNGRRYIGARIAYDGLKRGSERAAARLAKRYKVGQKVRVHHNPKNPRAATLKRGVGLFLAVPLLFGISGLLLGALALIGTFIPAPQERLHTET